jgi:hypothetical protein
MKPSFPWLAVSNQGQITQVPSVAYGSHMDKSVELRSTPLGQTCFIRSSNTVTTIHRGGD